MKPNQADSVIEEEHLLDFVIHSLDEELTIELGENVEVTAEQLYEVLAEFLKLLDGLDIGVKAVYLDRRFYNSTCLGLLYVHNYAYAMPIIRWGETILQEFSEGWRRGIQHELTGKLDSHSWTVEFPVYIDCTYLNGRYDENGVARHGYAADAPFIELHATLDTITRNGSVSSRAIACPSKPSQRQRREMRR